MTVQSQRTDAALEQPKAGPPSGADGWLAPVLVRRGVLTPDQADDLGRCPGGVWGGALERTWATNDQIVGATQASPQLRLGGRRRARLA